MNRTTLTALLVITSTLSGTATCNAEPPKPGERDELFVEAISEHLDLPTNQVLEKSFWTRTELIENKNSHLYYCDPFATNSARIVAAQLKQVYDARKANNENESAANGIKALAHVRVGNDFEWDPITDTPLYKTLHEQYSVTDVAAQSWVHLVQNWHDSIATKHKEKYLQALNEAIQTIPKLADAIIMTHRAVRKKSPPLANDEPDPGMANVTTLEETILAERLSTDLRKLKEQQGESEFTKTCQALIEVMEAALAKAPGCDPATLHSGTSDAVTKAIATTAGDMGKAWGEAHNELVAELKEEHKGGFDAEKKAHWISLYQIGLETLRNAMDAPTEEELLADLIPEVDALIQKFKAADDQGKVQQELDELASKIRQSLFSSGPGTTVSELRGRIRKIVGDFIFAIKENRKEWLAEYKRISDKMKADFQIDDSTASVDDWRVFYREFADKLSPPKEKGSLDSIPALPANASGDVSSLEAVFAQLQAELRKFNAATPEKHEEHVRKFLASVKEIIETQHADADQIKAAARQAAMNVIENDVKGTKPRRLWTEAYDFFEDWAEARPESNTVEEWKASLTRLSDLLMTSINSYYEWVARAKQEFLDKKPSTGGRTATSSSRYATLGAVHRARVSAWRRARYERNGLRLQAIRGGY